jgi:hypothetical protein
VAGVLFGQKTPRLKLRIEMPTPLSRMVSCSVLTRVFCRIRSTVSYGWIPKLELREEAVDAVEVLLKHGAGRDASTAESRPSDDSPPLSMTERAPSHGVAS